MDQPEVELLFHALTLHSVSEKENAAWKRTVIEADEPFLCWRFRIRATKAKEVHTLDRFLEKDTLDLGELSWHARSMVDEFRRGLKKKNVA